MDLTLKKCIPCEGGDPPLLRAEVEKFILEIKGWSLSENGILKIKQEFKFGDFASALLFVNKVGEIAEGEGHHPDICFGWGKVEITLYTHAVGGLSENDFIMAAKINQLQTK